MMGYTADFNKVKIMEIIHCVFPNHGGVKLEVSQVTE